MKKVLFVIDMIKDFVDSNGALFCGEAAQKIIIPIKEKINEYEEKDNDVIFICDNHKEDDEEFKRFPTHAVSGTSGSLLIDDLFPKNGFLVHKTRYSGFFNTDLDEILRICEPDQNLEVELAGVCTSICVMCTAIDLCNRNIKTTVDSNCVADFDNSAHEFALKYMKNILGVNVS